MYPHRPGGQDQNAQYHYPPPPPPPPSNTSQPAPVAIQPNGTAYPPASAPSQQHSAALPPISEYSRPQDMAVIPPHHQPPPAGYAPAGYPPPPPPGHYGQPPYRPAHDPYRQQPPQGYAPYPPQNQPAPRQRTAIACRYCRRRKIRCSGFDTSEDGRCANCQRFSQECIFTPVSAQTQAFVPAHAAFRGQAVPANAQLYGAYGQPLPPQHSPHDPYAGSRPPPQGYTLPSPHYPQAHAQYPTPPTGQPPMGYPQLAHDHVNGANGVRKTDQPHTPTLPPPGHQEYRYPDPSAVGQAPVSPASNASHTSAPQPYYTQSQQQIRRSPPQAASPYAQDGRASASPHSVHQAPYPPYQADQIQNLRAIPVRGDGRTPPPPTSTPSQNGSTATSQAGGSRPGVTISSIVSADGSSPGARSQEDRNMLQRLGK